MRVVAIANQKGGCGKTTTSINLSACLASLQKKVLLIDLDPQGHSTCGFGVRAEDYPYSTYDLFCPWREGSITLSQVSLELNPCLDLLPSYVRLSAAEEELAQTPDKFKKLKHVLWNSYLNDTRYDYIIIDCPPNLGVLTYNAFEVADEVVVPVEPSFFSLHGLAKIVETLKHVNENRAQPLLIHALLTLFNSEAKLSEDIYAEVKQHFQDKLFKTIIHEDVMLKEAASAGVSIDMYNRNAQGYKDYCALAKEFLERDMDRQIPKEELGWDTVRRNKLGPREVIGGVLFQAEAEEADQVEVAGDFNQWVPEKMVYRPVDKRWQLVLPLPRGEHHYKFIVDGEWQLDENQQQRSVSENGLYNSLIRVN